VRKKVNYISSQNSTRIHWKSVIDRVEEELKWFEEQGIKPTLRTLFYRLVSLRVLPNTKVRYKQLSDAIVKARKDERLEWDCIVDEGRVVLEDFPEEYRIPEEHVQLYIDLLKNAYMTYKVPRWCKQPHYVEVWIEKAALAATISSFLDGRDVRIAVNKGYSGWTFLYENCMRLREKRDEGKKIHVLYFGDFDPSGDNMDDQLHNAFRQFDLEEIVDFQRVAVTKEHIEQFNLPPMPGDKETEEKIDNDTRTEKFVEKYGERYAVELDALLALRPDQFKSMVEGSVDQFFDQEIYEEVMAENLPEMVVRKKVRFIERKRVKRKEL